MTTADMITDIATRSGPAYGIPIETAVSLVRRILELRDEIELSAALQRQTDDFRAIFCSE